MGLHVRRVSVGPVGKEYEARVVSIEGSLSINEHQGWMDETKQTQ